MNSNLLYVVAAILLVVGAVWFSSHCTCNFSTSNFRNMGSSNPLGLPGRSHVEDRFLPEVMGNLGASSEQFNAAAKMIDTYDKICGKVSAAAEIQKILNTYGPSGNWTGLVSQLNHDLYSVKHTTSQCQGTTSPSCNIASDCAYGSLDPTLSSGLPSESIPGYDCVSGKCRIYRA